MELMQHHADWKVIAQTELPWSVALSVSAEAPDSLF